MPVNKNKDPLVDELDALKYQLTGGPEYQPSIPGLAFPVDESSTELEALIDELEQHHLNLLEQRIRASTDGGE